MATRQGATVDAPAARPGVALALRIVAPLLSLSVIVQAIFAGQGVFVDTDNLDIHGGIGNLTLLLAIAQAGLVFFAGFQGRARAVLLGASLLLLVLVVVQLGLGYSGRDGGQAAAWHIPTGVLIFGLTVGITATLSRYRAEPGG